MPACVGRGHLLAPKSRFPQSGLPAAAWSFPFASASSCDIRHWMSRLESTHQLCWECSAARRKQASGQDAGVDLDQTFIIMATVAGMAWMSPRGVPVEAVAAGQDAIREYIEEEARARLPDVVRITMPLQGRIRPIELREGDHVEAGQIVATADPSDLETDLIERSNTVKRYEKNLQQIDLAVEQAEQTVKASQAKYDFAERIFSRTKSLLNRSSTSLTELERDELQMTQAALDLRKEQLNQSMYEVIRGDRIDASVRSGAGERAYRSRAEIRSPVAGIVLNAVESNERVMAAGNCC